MVPYLTHFFSKGISTDSSIKYTFYVNFMKSKSITYQTKSHASFLYKKLTYEYLTFRLFSFNPIRNLH